MPARIPATGQMDSATCERPSQNWAACRSPFKVSGAGAVDRISRMPDDA